MTVDEYKKILTENICKVTFEKKDGTEREMTCTLIPNMLPEIIQNENENKPKRNLSDDVVRCFDLEKNAWRSFKPETVINFKF